MAETFICKGKEVYFTNSGCHELYIAWSKCAEQLHYNYLAKLLFAQTELGFGFAADGIDADNLSCEFNNAVIKAELLNTMDALLDDINSHGGISSSMDVNWDNQLRINWLSKLQKLRDALYLQVIS